MLTALVCTRGRPHLLDGCLRSVLAALPEGGELIVVERREDGVEQVALPVDPPVRHLWTSEGGKSRQLNQGLRVAENDVVVITDDDCLVAEEWLVAMAAPFEDPVVGAVFGNVVGLSSVEGRPQAPVAAGPAPRDTWSYANGAAMAVRRSAAIGVGGFDERLGPGAAVHGEEHDLVLRLQEHGWEIHVAAAPPVEHLEWRDVAETKRNLHTYSQGAGAFLGAALRRAPRRWSRTVLRRARYQASLWGHADVEGALFGPSTTAAFVRGLVRGFAMRPRRFL